MSLDSEIAAFVGEPVEQPLLTAELVPMVRLGMAAGAAAMPRAEVGAVRDLVAPGPAGDIKLRLYLPEGTVTPPLLFFIHGGGWMLGNLETHDAMCRQLAWDSGYALVAIDYRLAPEHPFPAGLDDCDAAWGWLCANAARLGCDPARIALGGESAGANLTAALALRLRDRGAAQPLFQLIIHPVTDMRFPGASIDSVKASGMTRANILAGRALYLPDPADIEHPHASPFLAGDHRGLAPAIILTAEEDPLRDDGETYALALAAAGVETLVQRLPGLPHGFLFLPTTIGTVRRAYGLIGALLRRYATIGEHSATGER